MSLKIITNMTPISKPALSNAPIQQVRAYWEALRTIGALPSRDLLDPRGMVDVLEKVFLIEQIAPGHARFRLAGTQLHDLLGMDLRGMPLSALLDPSSRPRLSNGLDALFESPTVLDLWLQAERGLAREALTARMVLLPLAEAKGEARLALGCLAIDGAIGRAPRRFSITGMVTEPLVDGSKPAPTASQPLPATCPQKAPVLRLVSSRS